MRFRPCIDIHNGRVKQIVGGSLRDSGENLSENYISDKDASFYADIYKGYRLRGGHIAMLNAAGTPEYDATVKQAVSALKAFPGGLQIGGGINAENAYAFIEAGASHVIVTSYVFREGRIDYERLDRLKASVGSEHIVLDLSCRRKPGEGSAESKYKGKNIGAGLKGAYYIVTDRWQKFTDTRMEGSTFDELSGYCDEFLVHAVDVEGKRSGVDEDVLGILAQVPHTITYAGGVSCLEDIKLIKDIGRGSIDVTVGSALKLFGGSLRIEEVIGCIR